MTIHSQFDVTATTQPRPSTWVFAGAQRVKETTQETARAADDSRSGNIGRARAFRPLQARSTALSITGEPCYVVNREGS